MKRYSLDIKSSKAQIIPTIKKVKSILELSDKRTLNNIELCLQEALANAITHGNKNDSKKHIKVNYFIQDEYLHVIIEDEGNGISPLKQEKTVEHITADNLLDESGRGIMLMKYFCHEVKFDEKSIELVLSLKA